MPSAEPGGRMNGSNLNIEQWAFGDAGEADRRIKSRQVAEFFGNLEL